jgi:hypothetical protein
MAIDSLSVFQSGSSSQKIFFTLLLGVAIGLFMSNYILLSGGDLPVFDKGHPDDENHVTKIDMTNATYTTEGIII